MVLPTDKSAKAFNVAVTKINHKYSGTYSKLTKQALEAKEKMNDLQLDLARLPNDIITHERVTYWISAPYMSFN